MSLIIGPPDVVRRKVIARLRKQEFFKIPPLSPDDMLSNEIHKLFYRERFVGITNEAYENMKPALRLASRFLTDTRVLDYFKDQMLSNVERTPNNSPIYRRKRNSVTDPDVIHGIWSQQLDDLARKMEWHFIKADQAPKDMPMGLTLGSSELRTALLSESSVEKTRQEVQETNKYLDAARLHKDNIAQLLKVDASPTSSLSRPHDSTSIPPAVLLHGFFADFFQNLPTMSDESDDDATCYQTGVSFLLAEVVLHELAHCFHQFPEIKMISQEVYANEEEATFLWTNGRLPECGISWERSVFGKRVIRFVKFHTTSQDDSRYLRHEDFLIPEFQDFVNLQSSGDWWCSYKEKNYKTTAEHHFFVKSLIPWKHITKWFREDHWNKDKHYKQLLAPPDDLWNMRYEIPCPTHQASVDAQIVRAELEGPELDDLFPRTTPAEEEKKRDGDEAELEDGGSNNKKPREEETAA